MLSLIQCALDCRHQKDGYCFLENIETLSSINDICPYYKLKNVSNGFIEVSDADDLY